MEEIMVYRYGRYRLLKRASSIYHTIEEGSYRRLSLSIEDNKRAIALLEVLKEEPLQGTKDKLFVDWMKEVIEKNIYKDSFDPPEDGWIEEFENGGRGLYFHPNTHHLKMTARGKELYIAESQKSFYMKQYRNFVDNIPDRVQRIVTIRIWIDHIVMGKD